MATPPAKRKIFCLNVEQKREICMYHIENPGKTQKEIAEVFSAKFGDVVGRRTIGDILANMQRWMIEVTHSGSAKRLRCAKYGRLEEALQLWYADARMTNPVISDSVLREKAKEIGSELGIDDPKFQYSNGWLHRFKNRCATNSFIKSYNPCVKAIGRCAGGHVTRSLTIGLEADECNSIYPTSLKWDLMTMAFTLKYIPKTML
ncbi:tigger transposable element-derived protein 4 [Biomphalaria glabrata]|nr:tigger transposable element-derived protein 4-like [Biomphalaria glabrata]